MCHIISRLLCIYEAVEAEAVFTEPPDNDFMSNVLFWLDVFWPVMYHAASIKY